MTQFRRQREFGTRPAEGGTSRGRKLKNTDQQISSAAEAIRSDLLLNASEVKRLGVSSVTKALAALRTV